MNPERLDALFDAWSESRLTPAEATELSAHLRADPEARARFREAAAFHGHRDRVPQGSPGAAQAQRIADR